MGKLLVLLAMLMISAEAYACRCSNAPLTDYYQQSQFVAKAKILKVTQDPSNEEYHDAEIELITLYKGERLKKIKIRSVMKSSCSFLPKANTTWLIFASIREGMLSFDLCSGSLQTDRKFIPPYDTRHLKNYREYIELKQEALEYLRDHNIDPNPQGLDVSNSALESIRGYKNKSNFAVFQIEVNADLSMAGIKVLKKFQNGALTELY
ncbi:MAG TPA: hypothetical protein VK541_22910 [Pedobacter sp.]|uniref:hypothetical protein n=1 Tax=Pedobacter sp. TaxID=1411316 RepID=UPI002B85F0BF|nr:hypothetical protein [Pedobacter sp.]HMI05358.1 hypothetical protein [Pedobacter sp.]